MARKRAEEKQEKSSFSKSSFKYGVIGIIFILIIVVGGIYALTLLEDKKPSESNSEPIDKWLFAMDTDNVQYKYGASGIPTLAIIDKEGNVVFYNQGATSKDSLMPYITSAIEGTAESLGEEPAPDFTVNTFNNQEFTLSEHREEVIILDIMGVGCPPCEYQMPELRKIKQELGDEITILSVDVYYSGETAQDVLKTYGEYILR
jgi:thiol-disulfide isomerase/thioredoxin